MNAVVGEMSGIVLWSVFDANEVGCVTAVEYGNDAGAAWRESSWDT